MRTRQSAAEDREARLERFSFSRGGSHLRCPKADDYRYNQKLLPMSDAFQLTRGTMIHAGLEAANRAQFAGERGEAVTKAALEKIEELHDGYLLDPFIAMLIEGDPDDTENEAGETLRNEYHGLMRLSQNVCERVIKKNGFDTGRWETIVYDNPGHKQHGEPMIEFDMEIVVDGLPIHCKIDWVVRDTDTGLVYECDYKTRKQFTKYEDDEYNAQHPMYMYALAQYGVHVDGSMTFQIKAAVPNEPKLNKPTKKVPVAMSRTAIATDWKTYREALIKVDLDPADYLDMKDKLREFELVHPILRTPEECHSVWRDQTRLLLRLHKGDLPTTRVLNPRTCKGCEYSELCMEELREKKIPENELHLFGLTSRQQRLDAK